VDALERDLAHLRVPRWRRGLSALPATREYAERVRECAERWPAGYPAAFKREYRKPLDAVPADDLEKQRIVAGCKRAFALNTGVFRALGEEFRLSA